MDLGKKSTDSGLLNEIKNLLDKKNPASKGKNIDDGFEKMIRKLDESHGMTPDPENYPPKENKKASDSLQAVSFQKPSQINQPEEPSMSTQKTMDVADHSNDDSLPSFEGTSYSDNKSRADEYNTPSENRLSSDSITSSMNSFHMDKKEDIKEDIDLLVPAPPPELMQQKTPKLDVDRLMNVEEIYLNEKGKEKYGTFKIREEIDPRKPIFIKVDNYEHTLHRMIDIKTSTAEFSEILFRMENLSDSQDTNFSKLHNQLEDIQRKMIFIDTLLFEKI